jgi:hypothetical protein
MAASSLGLAVIAAAWFTESSPGPQVLALAFLVASVLAAAAARAMTGHRVTVASEWSRAACALLGELGIYAALAGAVSLAGAAAGSTANGLGGPLGPSLQGTMIGHAGGLGASGAWALAVVAAVALTLNHTAALCAAGPAARLPRLGAVRLLLAGLAVLLAGPRLGLVVVLVLALLGLLVTLLRPGGGATGVAGYRGDGPVSAWIGGLVAGRLPPLAPLLVGLLVTCMLAALGLRNLPGILVLTPAEAMLLAALGSSHLHDGPGDWRVPAFLQAGEYVFLAAAGYAGHTPGPVTFGLVAAVGLRHLDMAYRARQRVPLSWFMDRRGQRLPRADWRGFGWEGRMILIGIALLGSLTTPVFVAMGLYLAGLEAADYIASWRIASLVAPRPGPRAAAVTAAGPAGADVAGVGLVPAAGPELPPGASLVAGGPDPAALAAEAESDHNVG